MPPRPPAFYTFGTPFLSVPLAQLPGRVTVKQGWFGAPYLELALEGGQEFHKRRFLYRLWANRLRLRIYTRDAQRLRLQLGAWPVRLRPAPGLPSASGADPRG